MAIKVVSWDVYGTLISSKLYEAKDERTGLRTRARLGALETLQEINKRGIMQVTSSDEDLEDVKANLKEAGIPTEIFVDLYRMQCGIPKDYSLIIQDFKIKPIELMVIGDRYEIDVKPALIQGCKAIWVPEYFDSRSENQDIRIILNKL